MGQKMGWSKNEGSCSDSIGEPPHRSSCLIFAAPIHLWPTHFLTNSFFDQPLLYARFGPIKHWVEQA
ncbi:hypothetical protein TBK1r_60980 [Stieleria magnilauensis]|uniref:Ycf15 n=1 Tax=Stieleria magnilauensis TaxID=2527963 RepID=A0ABX5Y1J6_9BACT|nr:hypothetical protein TBK1r_60980 [Planctomycetes bacterium TBK1r]